MTFEIGKNTYMSVEEADSIIDDIYDETEQEYIGWNALDEKQKQRKILKGTRLIDDLPFLGVKYPCYSTLKWPRLINLNKVDCPYDIKAAILKQSLKDMINSNREESQLQELGVKSYSIKGASISFSDSQNQKLSNGIYSSIYNEYLTRWIY